MLFKYKLLGRPYRWGGEDRDSEGRGTSDSGTTYSDSSGSVTTYSDGSATWTGSSGSGSYDASADNARQLAEQEAARQAAAKAEADRVAAAQEAARIEAERVAAEQAANEALVEQLGGWATPAAEPEDAPAKPVTAPAEDTEGLASRTFNLATLGTNNKPGESLMASAQSKMAVVDMPEAVRQSKEQGIPLSSIIGEPNRAQLQRLQDMGLGNLEGVNPNNLTGQNVNHMLASAKTGDALERAGTFATNAALGMVPGGQYIGAGIRAYNAVQGGMSLEDAAKASASDMAMGWLGGKVNGVVGQALGPDGRAAMGVYNRASSLANLAGYDLPGVNAGSYVSGAVRNALDLPTLSGKRTGLTASDGAPIPSLTGGWSSGSSSGGSGSTTPVAPAPAPTANVVDLLTNMRNRFDGAGLGRAIREGAANRQQSRRA